MTALNARRDAIDEWRQRVALAENNHTRILARLEQARINRTLDDERISSLSLVQPAKLIVATATGPRRINGFRTRRFTAGATASGVATSLASAWLNPTSIIAGEQLAAAD